MKLLFKILLISLPYYSLAQDNPIYLEPTRADLDSLHAVSNQNVNDTLKMNALRDLSLYYLDIDTDSSLHYIKKALPLAQKLKLQIWEADALDLVAINLRNQGNYPGSLRAFKEGLEIAESKNCEKGIWRISKFTNSNKPHFARLSILATLQSDMVELYAATANYDKESEMALSCFAIAKDLGDYTLLSQSYRHLGQIFTRNGRFDSALSMYEKYFEASNQAGFRKYGHLCYNNIGNIYLKLAMPKEALSNYHKALQVSKDQNNYWGIGSSHIAIAKFYNASGRYDSALQYAKTGLLTFLESGQVRYYNDAYNTLVSIYKNLNMPDSALLNMEAAASVRDSLINLEKIKLFQGIDFEEQLHLRELEKQRIQARNRAKSNSLIAGLIVFLMIALILYRNNLQKQKANKLLGTALANLKATQTQLIQSEKMASLGELTAGIAHEIQNPLNFVNNFSEVNSELSEEILEAADKGDMEEVKAIARDIKSNQQKIAEHGKRADSIVKNMLQHSHSSSGLKEPTDLNKLADEYLRYAYHRFRAKDKSFSTTIKTNLDPILPVIPVMSQDIGRVLLNLINNAFYAVNEQMKIKGDDYQPEVKLSTEYTNGHVIITIRDNGPGIPENIKDKIFQPFFTTKPTGEGTGLGLSLSYDIIKAHGGKLEVQSKEGEGSYFTISLPKP